ncbi:hypothetical protein ACH5RR_000822 [Cinchona calisaya]|uniref:Uncharacterized protein n=1 Tax=Cinchona calisaya TaxID=153742 RepID=A0ABD3B276_9GENT
MVKYPVMHGEAPNVSDSIMSVFNGGGKEEVAGAGGDTKRGVGLVEVGKKEWGMVVLEEMRDRVTGAREREIEGVVPLDDFFDVFGALSPVTIASMTTSLSSSSGWVTIGSFTITAGSGSLFENSSNSSDDSLSSESSSSSVDDSSNASTEARLGTG